MLPPFSIAAPTFDPNGDALAGALFPADVRLVATRWMTTDDGLFSEELASLRNAAPKRRYEFAAGRRCARTALQQWGLPASALPVAPDRRPIWPAEMTGSITHTDGFCAAAVAPTQNVRAIGLDAERIGRIEDKLLDQICTPEELEQFDRSPTQIRETLKTLFFSAKESFYKCLYAVHPYWMGFEDISLSASNGCLQFLPKTEAMTSLLDRLKVTGKYIVNDDILLSAVTLHQT